MLASRQSGCEGQARRGLTIMTRLHLHIGARGACEQVFYLTKILTVESFGATSSCANVHYFQKTGAQISVYSLLRDQNVIRHQIVTINVNARFQSMEWKSRQCDTECAYLCILHVSANIVQHVILHEGAIMPECTGAPLTRQGRWSSVHTCFSAQWAHNHVHTRAHICANMCL